MLNGLGRTGSGCVSLKETTMYLQREESIFQSLQKKCNARVNIHSEFFWFSIMLLQVESHEALELVGQRKMTLSAIPFWVATHCTGPISAILRFCHRSIITLQWQYSCRNSAKLRTVCCKQASWEYTTRIVMGFCAVIGWKWAWWRARPV